MVVGDRRDVITFIDAASGNVIEELSGRSLAPKGIEINEFKFSNSGDFLFILLGDGTIRTYEVPSLDLYHKVTAHPAPCFCVDVDPRGRCVTHRSRNRDLSMLADDLSLPYCRAAQKNRYIAVGSTDALVSLWDLQEWSCVRTFTKSECVRIIPWRVSRI